MEEEKLKELEKTFETLKELSVESIENAVIKHTEYVSNNRYSKDGEILHDVINAKKDILNNVKTTYEDRLKVIYEIATLINAFYSTRMGNDRVYEVAKFIHEKYIEPESYSPEKICQFFEEYEKNKITSDDSDGFGAYSFLTKYIAITDKFLNSKEDGKYSNYPIYDRFVAEGILQIDQNIFEGKKELKINANALKKYNNFYCIMMHLKDHLNTPNHCKIDLTKLDNYFWYKGKISRDYYVKMIKDQIKAKIEQIDVEQYKDRAAMNQEIAKKIEMEYNLIKQYIPIAIKEIKKTK